MARPVILDVDTGVDDALALMLAGRSDALNVLGVTCVAGNVEVEKVVRNTLAVLDVVGREDVPVAAGYHRPLVQAYESAAHVHGENGLGDTTQPYSQRRPSELHAVEFMAELLDAAEAPVTLVALAPLTNVAGLLRQHPDLLGRIERIVCMGGAMACGGNATAAAEFNIWGDPEAAAIVFDSGAPLTMYGLDVFRCVNLSVPQVEKLASASKPWTPLLTELLRFFQVRFDNPEVGLGDAGTVAATILPDALTTHPHRVDIELAGVHTRGMTVVDRRRQSVGGRDAVEPNVDVAYAVDSAACCQLFVDVLA